MTDLIGLAKKALESGNLEELAALGKQLQEASKMVSAKVKEANEAEEKAQKQARDEFVTTVKAALNRIQIPKACEVVGTFKREDDGTYTIPVAAVSIPSLLDTLHNAVDGIEVPTSIKSYRFTMKAGKVDTLEIGGRIGVGRPRGSTGGGRPRVVWTLNGVQGSMNELFATNATSEEQAHAERLIGGAPAAYKTRWMAKHRATRVS